MDEPTGTQQPPDAPRNPGSKRPYAPPAIAWDEAWDAHANLMAACGQKDVMQPGCDLNTTS
jgi:hypothetical protein